MIHANAQRTANKRIMTWNKFKQSIRLSWPMICISGLFVLILLEGRLHTDSQALNGSRNPILYHFAELGTLGGSNSWAFGINDDGKVVGGSEVEAKKPGYTLPFVYDSTANSRLMSLPVPKVAGLSMATTIGLDGEITGYVGTGTANRNFDSESVRGAVWKSQRTLPRIVATKDSENNRVTAVTASGTLIGLSFGYRALDKSVDAKRVYEEHPFAAHLTLTDATSPGKPTLKLIKIPVDVVGEMVILPGGDILCVVAKTNFESGQLQTIEFASKDKTIRVLHGNFGKIPAGQGGARILRASSNGKYVAATFPTVSSEPRTRLDDMNDWERDQQNKSYVSRVDLRLHKLSWKKLLGLPNMPLATVQGVNDAGFVVGSVLQRLNTVSTNVQPRRRAVVWLNSSNLPRDLNDLIPEDTGWELISATSINNNGSIVGYAKRKKNVLSSLLNSSSDTHAFLLTPVKQ